MVVIMKQTLIIVLLCIVGDARSGDLMSFKSDGCSAFPDGTFEQNSLWLKCCVAHDVAYWKGGSYQQRVTADLRLQTCVDGVGEPHIAKLMLAGVRVGGTPYLPTDFRWGYGWPYPRGYKALTEDEQDEINAALGVFDNKKAD